MCFFIVRPPVRLPSDHWVLEFWYRLMPDFKIVATLCTIFWENWGLRACVWGMFQKHENVAEGRYFSGLKNFWQYEHYTGTISELGHMKSKWCMTRNRHMARDVDMPDLDQDEVCAVNKPWDGAFRTGNGSLHWHSMIVRSKKFSSTEFQVEFS